MSVRPHMPHMLLVIGLGNPGAEYEGTRHNVGRDVLAALARNLESGISNIGWSTRVRLHAEILECEIAGQRVVLGKPTTFMNESGKAAAALTKKYPDAQLLVVHDDLDLPVGILRLTSDGSSGGQKGVQSIIDTLGTHDFLRLRIGIGPNATPDGHRIPAEDFVLKRFPSSERPAIDTAIARAVETVTVLLRDGLPAAQRLANT